MTVTYSQIPLAGTRTEAPPTVTDEESGTYHDTLRPDGHHFKQIRQYSRDNEDGRIRESQFS
jgi:hypothetical protein